MSLQQYKYNTTRIPANEDIKHNNKNPNRKRKIENEHTTAKKEANARQTESSESKPKGEKE